VPFHGRQIPAKANGARSTSSANQCGTFGVLSVYSQNEVAGTRQRHSGFSHPRQYGEATLRTFVTGRPPMFGGGGNPQRIDCVTRSLSRMWITGATWSGNTAGRGGWLAVWSCFTLNRAAIASRLVYQQTAIEEARTRPSHTLRTGRW
jgi:hypothetical protein